MIAAGTYINTTAHSVPESFYFDEPVAGNTNTPAVTDTFNLTDHGSATLSFWHKYNLTADQNGVFLQVGYKDITQGAVDDWDWKYISPANYTGNISTSEFVNDTWGNPITDCWNNISGGGTYDWEHVEIDLRANVPAAYSDEVRVKFNYTQFGGGSGDGWYVDDVRITASRLENVTIEPNFKDIWQMTNRIVARRILVKLRGDVLSWALSHSVSISIRRASLQRQRLIKLSPTKRVMAPKLVH